MYGYYEVEANDTLSSIANKFVTTVEDIAEINQISPLAMLKVGERIIVPLQMPNLLAYYRVKKGDTLTKIANNYNISVKDLAALNGIKLEDYIYENDLLVVPKNNVSIYITRKGDTLKHVSDNLGISESAIIEENPMLYLVEDQLVVYNDK